MNTMQKRKNVTAGFFLIESFFWGQYAVILGFASMYLLDRGMSNTAIGILIGISGLISAILQPLLAAYADKPKSMSLKTMLAAAALMILLLGGTLIISRERMLITALSYAAALALLQLMTPFVNALGVQTMNQGYVLNFGFARGGGSLVYAVVSYVIGAMAARYGTMVVPGAIVLVFGGFIASLLFFPFQKEVLSENGKELQAKDRGADHLQGSFFARYPRFALVLAGCILLYFSHNLINSFAYQIVSSKGGGSEETGLGMAIAAVTELLPMFCFAFMLKKVRCDIWFRMTGIFFTLKTVGTLLAPNIETYYAIQPFQMLGWGVISVASVYYVNSIMAGRDKVKGQAYVTMTFTLGSVLSSLVGGRLIDQSGVRAMLMVGSAAAIGGMVILLLATEKTEE